MSDNTCFECGGQLTLIKGKPYEYKESGLDNVLIHGIDQYKCKACGGVMASIPRIEELHRVLGRNLCCKPQLFSGKEIKFLRKELNLKSKHFAMALGVAAETVSRWENSKKSISEAEDRLIRSLYMMYTSEQKERVLHHDVLGMFASMSRKRTIPKRPAKIELNSVDWLNKEAEFCPV